MPEAVRKKFSSSAYQRVSKINMDIIAEQTMDLYVRAGNVREKTININYYRNIKNKIDEVYK